jgi:hypothetical protein
MTGPGRRLTEEAAELLTLSTEPWLSCEDCFRLVDVYAEAVLADPDTPALPEMRVHLRGCGACAEEAATLLEVLAEDSGGQPAS